MRCGHLFCVDCSDQLSKNAEFSSVVKGKKYVRCAMCRENCGQEESYHVSTKKSESSETKVAPQHTIDTNNNFNYELAAHEFKNIKIKGESNSAKVNGIVKCVVKILREDHLSKCIIFSENMIMLEMIADLLKVNTIGHVVVHRSGMLQKKIEEFKSDKNVNVLLIPYSHGANGLNIIEATHVLLVEPTLNVSQEVQAIGRVHRIGQTKQTFVYRFLIRNSIEELVYSLFKSGSSYSKKTAAINSDRPNTSKALCGTENAASVSDNEKAITINDIKSLFFNL
jgi:E3 ubiquitin-protein ligase SHPRH